MKSIIENLKKTFVPQSDNKRFKECDHGFEISDVLNINKDPECNKCGVLLSHLNNK